jgi:uncharacterized protein DUF4410
MGAAIGALLVAGCAQTEIRSQGETMQQNLPAPGRVLVYNLAVNAEEVTANQSIVAREIAAQSSESSFQQATEIGHQAADAFATDLVAELLKTGLNAQRATRETTIYQNDVLVLGHFIDVNEGNRLRRLVIGFGAGASDVDAQIFVSQEASGRKRELLEFATHADSGEMPGAAVTMGAGAAAQGGMTAGVAAANVAVSGVKTYRSETAQLAGRAGNKAAGFIARFAANEGWITKEQAQNAESFL